MKCKSLLLLLVIILNSSVYGHEDFTGINLATYLYEQDTGITEGHITPSQKAEFIKDIQKLPHIKKILEIGFNAGHSAEFFLEETDCEKLVSFDICTHRYVKTGAEFITKKYGDRFTLIEGDSMIEVPEYAASHSDEKFDIIFVDGGHSFHCCLSDIQNCSRMAHAETLLIIDDYVAEVKSAVSMCVLMRLITIEDLKFIRDDTLGDRIWITAKYIH